MRGSFQDWWRRVVIDPPRYEHPWLIFVVGAVLLFYGLSRYLSEGSLPSALIVGVGTVLLGVAQYLPSRWHAIAVALRVMFLLSLIVMTVLFFTELVS
jgi:hypothetical protein